MAKKTLYFLDMLDDTVDSTKFVNGFFCKQNYPQSVESARTTIKPVRTLCSSADFLFYRRFTMHKVQPTEEVFRFHVTETRRTNVSVDAQNLAEAIAKFKEHITTILGHTSTPGEIDIKLTGVPYGYR